MELRFACPQCGTESRLAPAEDSTVLTCPACDYVGLLPLDWVSDRRVRCCPICGSDDLYRHRDFHQKLAVVVVVAGAALALLTRFVSLAVAAVLCLLLYRGSPESLVCYLCRARIRGHEPGGRHGRFDPRVEERVRKGRGRGPRAGHRNSQSEIL